MCTVGVHLDLSLSLNEEVRFKQKHSKLIRHLTTELPFDLDEIERIVIIYYKFKKNLSKGRKVVTKIQMKDLLHSSFDITDEMSVFRISSVLWKTIGPFVTVNNFVRAMALFLKGSFEDKAEFCYKCYTTLSLDGTITRDVMYQCVSTSFVTVNKDENVEDIARDFAHLIQKTMDLDRDGKITLEEYMSCIEKKPDLMQFLGQCLPSRAISHSLLTTITNKKVKF